MVPEIIWDVGTACDLFISLEFLHQPAKHGLRKAWAAGVRARLPEAAREILLVSQMLFYVPLHWIHTLPAPKGGADVLHALQHLPAAERLTTLALSPRIPLEARTRLADIAQCGYWNVEDKAVLEKALKHDKGKMWYFPIDTYDMFLDHWVNPADFGVRYYEALQAYYEVFFAEEEQRIRPFLDEALERAQQSARDMPVMDMLEQLSQGLRFAQLPSRLVLMPSYWSTPLVYFAQLSEDCEIWAFGARPTDAALVPGESVPDGLLRALKTLADPTRLRILRYLAAEPLSPAELARRLRLRAPTMTHHLRALRLAGLVQVVLKDEKRKGAYALRPDAVPSVFEMLRVFLEDT